MEHRGTWACVGIGAFLWRKSARVGQIGLPCGDGASAHSDAQLRDSIADRMRIAELGLEAPMVKTTPHTLRRCVHSVDAGG